MAFGLEIYNLLPNEAYIIIHLIALLVGVWLASKAFSSNKGAWGTLFAFYAIAELGFVLAHIGVFHTLFSHLLAETLLLIGFLLVAKEMK
ncbi:MAG: hypothetical protein IPJ89_03140 [Candidatus Iainarchaeum archaeon]|uniref:Uncharacterized protein n=1 Tax=Candidatus Iainarchaeum sp. TaxID=3101447 RepID=A0A7T9I0P7_9ARCH|nr:MAG: hypothetical protein IPJ89_03140 [Candidatus Diapherotrites archaeon]